MLHHRDTAALPLHLPVARHSLRPELGGELENIRPPRLVVLLGVLMVVVGAAGQRRGEVSSTLGQPHLWCWSSQ